MVLHISKQQKYDKMYMDLATRIAEMSFASRKKVGAICVKDSRIISHGWNGMPTGFENECETTIDYSKDLIPVGNSSVTKPEVLHAESNVLLKLAKYGDSALGATLYTTVSPCLQCAKLIVQAGIIRVVYQDIYDNEPLDRITSFFNKAHISFERIT